MLSKVRASSPNAAKTDNPLSGLDLRAQEAKSGDPEAVRALADEIFATTAPEPEFQNPVVEDVKDRLVRAEVEYKSRSTGQESIDENNIVRTVNQVADVLQLPDYARTSPLQVRLLRLSLLPHLPHFIAQDLNGRAAANPNIHSKISNKVSPLEAAYLVLALVQQKRNNPAFQLTPKEFRDSVYARQIAAWQAHRESKGVAPLGSPTLSNRVKPAKGQELEGAAAYGMSRLPLNELVNMPTKLLDTLLTARKETKQ